MLPLQCGLFGRARRAEHAKACSHARPTKQNKNFSLVILNNKFDGALPRAIKPGQSASIMHILCMLLAAVRTISGVVIIQIRLSHLVGTFI